MSLIQSLPSYLMQARIERACLQKIRSESYFFLCYSKYLILDSPESYHFVVFQVDQFVTYFMYFLLDEEKEKELPFIGFKFSMNISDSSFSVAFLAIQLFS